MFRTVSVANHQPPGIIDALNAEWRYLCEHSDEAVRSWATTHPALGDCRTLADVVTAARDHSDAVLAALLLLDAGGGDLAGRAVLQILLGRVVMLSRRDPGIEVDDYVGATWCRIRTYPLAERPTRIASNVVLDAMKSVKAQRPWLRRHISLATLPSDGELERYHSDALAREVADHNARLASLTASEIISAADQLGLLDGATSALLASVYLEGLSGRAAAERHHTSPGMIRHRCSKAVQRLAEHATLLAEAAA